MRHKKLLGDGALEVARGPTGEKKKTTGNFVILGAWGAGQGVRQTDF